MESKNTLERGMSMIRRQQAESLNGASPTDVQLQLEELQQLRLVAGMSRLPGEEEEQVQGRWRTENQLAKLDGWNEQMAKNAVAWATAKGLKRTSPIHGLEEFKVPTDFSFSHRDLQRFSSAVSAEVELEDGKGILLGDGANLTSEGAILKGSNVANAGLAMATQNSLGTPKGKGKLQFPVLQCGTDPFSQLHIFVDVAGRKIDQAEDMKEKLAAVDSDRAKEAASNVNKEMTEFKHKYDVILAIQKDAMQLDAVPDQQIKGKLRGAICELVKADSTLNAMLSRCRAIKPPRDPSAKPAAKASVPGRLTQKAKAKAKGKAKSKPAKEEEEEEEEEPEPPKKRKKSNK